MRELLRRAASIGNLLQHTPTVRIAAEAADQAANEPHKLPTVFTDPFVKDGIKEVWVRFYRTGKGFTARGWVEFIQNNTEGKQTFDGATIEEILEKIEAFVKTLK